MMVAECQGDYGLGIALQVVEHLLPVGLDVALALGTNLIGVGLGGGQELVALLGGGVFGVGDVAGKRKGEAGEANGLNRYVRDFGVTIRYNEPDALR